MAWILNRYKIIDKKCKNILERTKNNPIMKFCSGILRSDIIIKKMNEKQRI